jgi:hypothetical protein
MTAIRNVVLCEQPQQVTLLENNVDTAIIALNLVSSYELERIGIPHTKISDLYRHEELWQQYRELTCSTLELTKLLDSFLWDVDPYFRDNSYPIFDFIHYPIKIWSDYIRYCIFLLDRIVERFPNASIHCLNKGEIKFDENLVVCSNFSALSWVVSVVETEKHLTVCRQYNVESFGDRESASWNTFQFGQIIRKRITLGANYLRFISSVAGEAFLKAQRICRNRGNSESDQVTVVSVGCKEIKALRSELLTRNVTVLEYAGSLVPLYKPEPYPFSKGLSDHINKSKLFSELNTYLQINYSELMTLLIGKLTDSLEHQKKLHVDANRYFDRKKVDIVFFESHGPFHPYNMALLNICRKREIPSVCWMHGGYGANYSLPGFDVVDYRLGRNHFVYGQAVKDVVESSHSTIKLLGIEDTKCYVAGSPYFEKKYRRLNNNNSSREKLHILFVIGNYFRFNQFYFGYNRPYAEMCNWEENKAILDVLIQFQDRYSIVVKDYPNSPEHTRVFQHFLKDRGGARIKVVSNEKSFAELNIEADIHIFTWVSTTFIESLYTDSDICLLDNSDISKEAREILEQNILFSEKPLEFVTMLKHYLEIGIRHRHNKSTLRRYFADSGNQSTRLTHIVDGIQSVREEMDTHKKRVRTI